MGRSALVHLTYTERGEDLHVISLREGTQNEARNYFRILPQQS